MVCERKFVFINKTKQLKVLDNCVTSIANCLPIHFFNLTLYESSMNSADGTM
ncbi:hypothetical protein Mapa_006868 [Marchantia paleacea]|nr:hypothetical protein Mapa_006868 [Marchantia paleacea]